MSEIEKTLVRWAQECQSGIRDCAGLLRHYFERPRQGGDKVDEGGDRVDFVLGNLSLSCLLTSDSALFLVANNKLWDAEILVRSVLEGTMKFVFLCAPDETERELRANEYWDVLPEIARLKRSSRVERFLALIKEPEAEVWRPLRDLRLSQDEISELRSRVSQKQKQDLERKWSFLGIAEHFAKSESSGFELLSTMFHGYGMSSHLAHQDGDGVGMIWERLQRSPERIDAITLAHGARELSDLFYTGLFRAHMAYRLGKIDHAPIAEVESKYRSFFLELDEAVAKWQTIEYGSSVE